MKLLTHVYSRDRADEVIGVLRRNDIAIFTKFVGTVSLSPFQLAIYVNLDAQYDDAVRLLQDPNHKVEVKVDLEVFEKGRTESLRLISVWVSIAIFIALIIVGSVILLTEQTLV